jgi:hypothetical protein
MLRIWRGIVAVVLLAVPATATAAKYSIKPATTAAPKELAEPIRKLLTDQSLQLLDETGAVIGELWFRKELPAKATPEQLKNGITYRELEETTILGAIRFDRQVSDYRKQKVDPGVYTLRLGFQPQDGDHMGTAPYSEFALLVPARSDKRSGPMDPKELRELSPRAVSGGGGTHPSVWLLFPNNQPEDTPKLADRGEGHWVLHLKEPVTTGSQKGSIGIGLTLIGHTAAE